jgi:alkylation response protein AidB-like acyl-CoA dehydrogenase
MDYITVVEAPDDMQNRIDFADICKKLVAQPFTLACPFDQPCDVHNFHCSFDDDLPLTTIARVVTSEAIHKVTKDAAECFGAMGVMRDMPLQKYIHDALTCLHAGEGNADARLRIAEALVNYRRPGSPLLAAE